MKKGEGYSSKGLEKIKELLSLNEYFGRTYVYMLVGIMLLLVILSRLSQLYSTNILIKRHIHIDGVIWPDSASCGKALQ